MNEFRLRCSCNHNYDTGYSMINENFCWNAARHHMHLTGPHEIVCTRKTGKGEETMFTVLSPGVMI